MEKLGPHFAHLDSATCRRLTMPPQRCGGRVSSEGRGRRSTGQADTGCGETPEYVEKSFEHNKTQNVCAAGDRWTSEEVFPSRFCSKQLET